MRIHIDVRHSFSKLPMAGKPPMERMVDTLSRVFGRPEMVWSPPQGTVFGEARLWVYSLFPLWQEQDLLSLGSLAAPDKVTRFFSSRYPRSGVLYIPANIPLNPRLDPRETNAQIEGVAMDHSHWEPLNEAGTWGDFSQFLFRRNARHQQQTGVCLGDPEQVWIEDDVQIAPGVWLGPSVYLGAGTEIDQDCRIHMGSWIRNSKIGPGVEIKPYSVIDQSRVGAEAQVGPFAHIRPESELGPETKVGNFVETKKVTMGRGSKASHLAYLGDAEIGENCNIGAGTITCNYDGANKWKTVLGNNVFIGSDSQLVAPVEVADGAFVAAGSTITRDVPANSLAIARSRQTNKQGHASKLRDAAQAIKSAGKPKESDS